MKPTKPLLSDDERRDQIRAAGLRVTYPRLEVLRLLDAAATPQSHAELVESLAAKGIDRVTIFRNLNDLAASGLVTKADHGDHVFRFERRREKSEHEGSLHPHFVCNECGDVVCLPKESLRIEVAKKAPRALRRGKFEVQLKGECDRCGDAG